MLTTYQDFISRVDELGFMALSTIIQGFPSLSAETPGNLWHTGLDTDPWQWKDKAAQEKQLAYGCILGGHKGFVSVRMYPIFYAAYHLTETMPDRWMAGKVSQTTWRLWQLFEVKSSLYTSQARKLLGMPPKKGGNMLDTAIKELQRDYYITVSGNEKKVNADGHLYGWPSNTYTRVTDWVHGSWLNPAKDWQVEEARNLILDEAASLSKVSDRRLLTRIFGFP